MRAVHQAEGLKQYDPFQDPEADEWLGLDDDERIRLVLEWHQKNKVKLPNEQLHALFHVIVENQIAEGVSEVLEAYERIQSEGLDRHDAIHALASVLSGELWKAGTGRSPKGDLTKEYFRGLKELTAVGWLTGANNEE